MSTNNSAPNRLGERLMAAGLITEDQLRIALYEQSRVPTSLGRLLTELGFLSEATLREALSAQLGRASVDLSTSLIDPAVLGLIPEALARRHRLIPVARSADDRRLIVAMADTRDLRAIDALRSCLPMSLELDVRITGENDVDRAIDRHYGHTLAIDDILRQLEAGTAIPMAGDFGQTVIRLIDALLADGVKRGASDIHFEPEAGFLRIRYRIDGLLRQIRVLHADCWPAMSVRLKILSGMNIAESRMAQDGRFSLNIHGRQIDFRAASLPTLHGENLVLRILDREKGIVPLNRLGLSKFHHASLERMLARPEGILLITGPTGSGKTTTLYSVLDALNKESVNIMTLEDPVEYPLQRLRQTSISEASKLDFAGGVRAILRQDPDIILIGEIRDAETARMAFRAAMTGHQVHATLHANSALGALPRLFDLGISPEMLAGQLIGIIAQRLVRRLCPDCREPLPDPAPSDTSHPPTGLKRYRAKGCQRCDFQGYRGRLAIMEVLSVDPVLDDMITTGASRQTLNEHLLKQGFRSLREDGLERVNNGETSLEELARVVDLGELQSS